MPVQFQMPAPCSQAWTLSVTNILLTKCSRLLLLIPLRSGLQRKARCCCSLAISSSTCCLFSTSCCIKVKCLCKDASSCSWHMIQWAACSSQWSTDLEVSYLHISRHRACNSSSLRACSIVQFQDHFHWLAAICTNTFMGHLDQADSNHRTYTDTLQHAHLVTHHCWLNG